MSTGAGPESIKLTASDILFDLELEVAAYKGSLAVEALGAAISVISSWSRNSDNNFTYNLCVSRKTPGLDFKMLIAQDAASFVESGTIPSLTIDAALPGTSYISEMEELQRKEELSRRLTFSYRQGGGDEYAVSIGFGSSASVNEGNG